MADDEPQVPAPGQRQGGGFRNDAEYDAPQQGMPGAEPVPYDAAETRQGGGCRFPEQFGTGRPEEVGEVDGTGEFAFGDR